MKQKAKTIIKNPLIYGSFIVVFGGILANFFNFLFTIFMIRLLSTSNYGVLASIISLITFPTLLVTAVNPLVVRFAGEYFAKGDQGLLKGLYLLFFRFLLICGVIVFVVFLIFIKQIGGFFHITNYGILLFADLAIFLSFVTAINASFLQAKLAFGFQVITSMLSSVTKLILGIIFVLVGYSVMGATGALVAGGIVAFLISLFPLRFIFTSKAKTPMIESKELFKYGLPSALTLLGLTSFISSDIILVRHFFDPIQAGHYAGLSVVGRVIFYLSMPIGSVMFPIIVQKHTKGVNFSNTFKLAVGLLLIPSILLTLFYYFFPKFTILFFLKRNDYLEMTSLLAFFGLYITFYCVLYLFANFYLSIKKTIIYIPVLIGAILQIALIIMYHQSFMQIIMISFVLVLLLVISFLLYYPYATKDKKQG